MTEPCSDEPTYKAGHFFQGPDGMGYVVVRDSYAPPSMFFPGAIVAVGGAPEFSLLEPPPGWLIDLMAETPIQNRVGSKRKFLG